MGMTSGKQQLSLEAVNIGPEAEVIRFLADALFSGELATSLVRRRPFRSIDELIEGAAAAWESLSVQSKKAAFDAHPRIGDIDEAQKRAHSQREQRGVFSADPGMLRTFAAVNGVYEQRFGYRDVVFASDKTATQMMALLETCPTSWPSMGRESYSSFLCRTRSIEKPCWPSWRSRAHPDGC